MLCLIAIRDGIRICDPLETCLSISAIEAREDVPENTEESVFFVSYLRNSVRF